jgi:hypothetical protein
MDHLRDIEAENLAKRRREAEKLHDDRSEKFARGLAKLTDFNYVKVEGEPAELERAFRDAGYSELARIKAEAAAELERLERARRR